MRLPLWSTLLPLAGLAVAYGLWWDARRDGWADTLAAGLGRPVAVGGFPYRLAAALGPVAIRREADGAMVELRASDAALERQPWRALVIGGARGLRLQASAPALAGARLDLEGARAQASYNAGADGLARLSIVAGEARLWAAALPVSVRAPAIELHLRRAAAGRAEVVVRAAGARIEAGEPVAIEARLALTGRLGSVGAWRQGGVLAVEGLTIAQGATTIATLVATGGPSADGRLVVAGAITTVCPRTLYAAWNRLPAPVEYRARRAVALPFTGRMGALALGADPAGLGRWPTRTREPACPRLR